MTAEKKILVGIDLGAGFGAKLGLFSRDLRLLGTGLFPLTKVRGSYQALLKGLCRSIEDLLLANDRSLDQLGAVGLASPGIFTSEGKYLVTSGFDVLDGRNLRADMAKALDKPVAIENDANAGALAEWQSAKTEMMFWVFGGGWGGAWVSHDGNIQYSSTDWDGVQDHLHYSNETGFAVPFERDRIRSLFEARGFDYRAFCRNLEAEGRASLLKGPSGDPTSLRAEILVSGTGMFRIFKANPASQKADYRHITDPSVAGKAIDELAAKGDAVALKTHELFGTALGSAGATIMRQAIDDGADVNTPIYLSGKPASAFSFFAEATQNELRKAGFTNQILLSGIHQKGENGNLSGASVLAQRLL